jgi:hypothetical protein
MVYKERLGNSGGFPKRPLLFGILVAHATNHTQAVIRNEDDIAKP